MSIKNRKVNRLGASEESSDLKENASRATSHGKEPEQASGSKKEASKRSRLSTKDLSRDDQSGADSNVPNNKRNRFISTALVCLNIAIFIVLFGGLLVVLKFAFAKIRQFLGEHVAAN